MRLLSILLLLGTTAAVADDSAEYPAAAYATCAACHLPDGAGLSGAFPRIRDRAAAMAALDGGREYLISVVSYGLMGPMTADGVTYAGVMPGQGGALDAAAIASALNYLVFELTDADSTGLEAFSGDEVVASQEATDNPSLTTAAQMRATLVEKHGEAWPQ